MRDSAFKYSEARVGEQIGQSRKKMREVRSGLVPDRDWKEIHGEILLTEDAVWMLAKLHLVAMPDLALCLPAEKQPDLPNGSEPTARKKMTIVPPKPLNSRLVYALDDDGVQQVVWVGRNATFCFNDVIEVEPHPDQKDIWLCTSPIPRDTRRPFHT